MGPAAGTHLELLVEFAAVSIQHGQIQRTKVGVETGDNVNVNHMTSFIHHGTPLDLLFIDEFIIGAEVVSVGGALGFTA